MPSGRTTKPYEIAQLASLVHELDRHLVHLTIKEQPARGRACRLHRKVRGPRWPLEPPPVIELSIASMAPKDMSSVIINSPNYFCTAELKPVKGRMTSDELIEGNTVASLTRVKINNTEHGIFVFNDIHVKDPGDYSLVFTMFEMRPHYNNTFAEKVTSIESNTFKIYENPRQLGPPVRPSSFISALMESGVRIKIRKDAPRRKKVQQDWSANITTAAALPAATVFPHRAPIQGMNTNISNTGEDISGRLRHNSMHNQLAPALGAISPQANYSFHPPMMTQPGPMPPMMVPHGTMNQYPIMGPPGSMPFNMANPAIQMPSLPERTAYPMARMGQVDQYGHPSVSNTDMQSMYSNQWPGNPQDESFQDQIPPESNSSGYPGPQGHYQGYGQQGHYGSQGPHGS